MRNELKKKLGNQRARRRVREKQGAGRRGQAVGLTPRGHVEKTNKGEKEA